MKLPSSPTGGWPRGYPEPEIVDDPTGQGVLYILLLDEHRLTADAARGIALRLLALADHIDAQGATKATKE